MSYCPSRPPPWLTETTGCCLPSNQHFSGVYSLTVLHPVGVSDWRGYQYIKACPTSDYTREFGKGEKKKNCEDWNLTCLWDMQRGRSRLRDGAHNFLTSGKQQQWEAFDSSQPCTATIGLGSPWDNSGSKMSPSFRKIAWLPGNHGTVMCLCIVTYSWLPSYAVSYRRVLEKGNFTVVF